MSSHARRQLLPNMFAGWFAFLASAIVGFVMPRLILDSVGQELLGLWDLCWSFLAYLAFTGLGTGSAVSHYIASQRDASSSQSPLLTAKTTIATSTGLQLLLAVFVGCALALVIQWLPGVLSAANSFDTEDVARLSITVGVAASAIIMGDIFQGVLVGNHQARDSEYINIAHDLSLALGMILVLAFGGGILGLASVTLILRVVFECVRFFVAKRFLPQQAFSATSFDMATAKQIVWFSCKSSFYGFQELIVYQSVRVSLFFAVGPAAFAAFSRYATITRQINLLVDRLIVPVPALTAQERSERVTELYAYGLRAVWMLALPVLCIFGVFGDDIVTLWMGEEFVVPQLAWIFCGACLLHSHYSLSAKILRGLDTHGRIALGSFIASLLALAAIVALDVASTATSAAWAISGVMIFCIQLPHLVFCILKLRLPIFSSMLDIFGRPLIFNILFLIMMAEAHVAFHEDQMIDAVIIFAIAGGALFCAYWFLAFDQRMRDKLRGFVSGVRTI